MIWEELYKIATDYILGGSRYEPRDTDCSGMVCAGFYKYRLIDPGSLGWWTGGMWTSDILETIWSGNTPDLPYHIMKPDDLIFTSTESPTFDTVNGSHVGLYTGNPYNPFLSHFADGGPYVTPVNGVYSGREKFFGVRRLIRDMHDDEILELLKELKKYLPAWLWEYNWENTAPFGNMYNCLVQTCLFTQDIKRDLERLEEKVEHLAKIIEQLPKE